MFTSLSIAIFVASTILIKRYRMKRICLVKGVCTNQIRKATPVDDAFHGNYVPFHSFFKGKINQDDLKEAIQKTLQIFPFAGGRFCRGDNRWDIVATGEGACFEIEFRRIEQTCEQLSDLSQVRKNTYPSYLEVPSKFLITENIPLLFVKLTIFNDGQFCVLTVSPSHFISDGSAICRIYQTMSFFCKNSRYPTTLPSVSFERNWTKEEEEKTRLMNIRKHHPFYLKTPDEDILEENNHKLEVKGLMEQAIKAHIVKQYLIKKEDISKYKQEGLKSSLNQILFGLLCLGLCESNGKNKEFTLLIVINLRKRSSIFPNEDFIGNASLSSPCQVTISSKDTFEEIMEKIGRTIHLSIKQVESLYYWFEAVASLNENFNFQNTWPRGMMTALRSPSSMILNSWRGYSWYDADFGTGSKPFRVGMDPYPSFYLPRYVQVEECNSSGDIRLLLTLRPDEIQCLENRIKDLGLPFQSICEL